MRIDGTTSAPLFKYDCTSCPARLQRLACTLNIVLKDVQTHRKTAVKINI